MQNPDTVPATPEDNSNTTSDGAKRGTKPTPSAHRLLYSPVVQGPAGSRHSPYAGKMVRDACGAAYEIAIDGSLRANRPRTSKRARRIKAFNEARAERIAAATAKKKRKNPPVPAPSKEDIDALVESSLAAK